MSAQSFANRNLMVAVNNVLREAVNGCVALFVAAKSSHSIMELMSSLSCYLSSPLSNISSLGRTVRVTVDVQLISPLLTLAVEVGFDWVFYAGEDYVRMSVIPDCEYMDF